MSEGTPLDALESGEVATTADASLMSDILREMNASGAEIASAAPPPPVAAPPMMPMQPAGPMMPAAPMYYSPMPPPPQNHYIPVDEPPVRAARKKNVWSSIAESVRDPIYVTFLVFVLSLPVLHTFLAKYASWAFAVGGQFSWFGLIAISLVGGVLFGLLQSASNMIGF